MEIVADAGHFPHWEQPRDVADRLSHFIESN
jgi:pimeloyl-ACP methyl ester carboxylesterase